MLRKGFTLIELLVVIAIIAILAAILFPVFLNAKASAQKANCMGNVRQMAFAFMLYLQSNNECFPEGIACKPGKFYDPQSPANYIRQKNAVMPGYTIITSDGVNRNYYVSWMDAIYPYLKSLNVFICPSIKQNTAHWVANAKEPNYGYNTTLSRFFDKTAPISASRIKRPSLLFMIFDYGSPLGACAQGYWVGPDAASGALYAVPHNGGMNVGIADGHVRWVSGNDPVMMDGRSKFGSSPYWY
jgi:prepilin-type N-terminal cleavage/methylation domain-containing protein/prepilin-type processing-associated H-X9-DG protein